MATRWLWATLLPAVVLLVAGGVLMFQIGSVQLGLARGARADHAAAAEAFERADALPVVERWIPSFNGGTAAHGMRQWDAAAGRFERAANLAPAREQCRIRLNWAWSLEAGADELAATDPVGSVARLQQAQFILALASCSEDILEEQWNDARERIEDKTTGREPPPQEEESSEASDNSDELLERELQAQEQRQQVMDEETRGDATDGEKTW